MRMRILLIDDEKASVDAVASELKAVGCDFDIVGFDVAENRIESYNPDVVVLDLLKGGDAEAEPAGKFTKEYIWKTKFCPLVVYTAAPERIEDTQPAHPFLCVVQKGIDSEKRVLERIQEYSPHIAALTSAAKEIRWGLNSALREIAPRIFDKIKDPHERDEALVRSARRRVAAQMDEAASMGAPNLKSWEFYLCPPVVEHLLTADILRRREGEKDDPTSYVLVLSPSCDLVKDETRLAKITEVLVSRCKSSHRLLKDLSNPTPKKQKEKLLPALRYGHTHSCLPLPALPGEFPTMTADLRDLTTIPIGNIGAGTAEYIRVASLDNPLRELVSWAFITSTGRPGLPTRDFGEWADEIIESVQPTDSKNTK